MYSKMFKDSTDLEHPCRVAGSTYLRNHHWDDPQARFHLILGSACPPSKALTHAARASCSSKPSPWRMPSSSRTLQIAGPRRCLIVEASCLIHRAEVCGVNFEGNDPAEYCTVTATPRLRPWMTSPQRAESSHQRGASERKAIHSLSGASGRSPVRSTSPGSTCFNVVLAEEASLP
eukprot:s2896_g6.t1